MQIFPFIKDVEHRPFCGPTAVALLTGVPISRAEHMIRRCRRGGYRNSTGKKIPIRGSYTWEVVKVLKRLGCKVQEFKVTKGSFRSFVDDTRYAGTFLVNVTNHFVVCSKGWVADNSHPSPLPIESRNGTQRLVRRAWKVVAPQLPKYTLDDTLVAARTSKPKRDVREVRAEKILARIKKWQRQEKLAKTKLKKLHAQLKRYQRLGVIQP